jgi:TonB family protein
MKLERLAPWIAAVAAHAVILFVVGALFFGAGGTSVRAVEISIGPGPAAGRAPSAAAAVPAGEARTAPAAPGGRLDAATVPLLQESSVEPAGVSVTKAPSRLAPLGNAAAGLPPDPLDEGFAEAGSAAAGATTDDGADVPVTWAGAQRRALQHPAIVYPEELRSLGQAADVVAQITVSPSGAVIKVEITQGTGYIEVDKRVADVLRSWVFSSVNEQKDEMGTYRYRFRLERTD